jgi:hypothetical protein
VRVGVGVIVGVAVGTFVVVGVKDERLVLPLGEIVSVLALALKEKYQKKKAIAIINNIIAKALMAVFLAGFMTG